MKLKLAGVTVAGVLGMAALAAPAQATCVTPTGSFTTTTECPPPPPPVKVKCNSGRGNGSEVPGVGTRIFGYAVNPSGPTIDCDPGNSGAKNNGGD